jgi:lipoprotein-anchoring transpeptidase ErfK/SrfK
MAALRSIDPVGPAPAQTQPQRPLAGLRALLRRVRRTVAALTLVATTALAAGSGPASASIARAFPAAGQLTVGAVVVRAQPNPSSRPVTRMAQFRPDYRRREIFAVAARTGTDGKPWYEISVPMRPNGTMGWIPAQSAQLAPTVARIVVHRRARTIDVYSRRRHALHAVVAIGAPGMETPVGKYFVQARFVPDDSFLGVFALETSAYSKLSEWPGGGVVGIHGTSMPQLLGQAVSHGCVRVSNTTAAALRTLAPLGTPITISD